MKFILDLKQHPALGAGLDEFLEHKTRLKERQEFIRRQIDNLQKESETQHAEFWKNVKTYVAEHGLCSEYSAEKHVMEFDKNSRQLFLYDKDEHHTNDLGGLGAILATIMKGPPGNGEN